MPVFANTYLFSFKQARICNDLVILFLRPAVSRPHTENPFQRTPDLQAQQECLERWGTVCHKCSLNCSRSSSYQKHQKLRGGRNMSKFFVVPSTFLALQVQSVVLVSASLWSVQFDHFLVFCSSYSRSCHAVICKSVGTCPRALDGVSVTFVLKTG